MLDPFSSPEAVSRHLKFAVTGDTGTGKTVLGLDAKNHGLGPVAVISNEAGDVHYVRHPKWGGFSRLATQSIAQFEQALAYLEANPGKYNTLVLDTITGVYEALVSAKTKDDGSVALKDWGILKRKWRSLMARLNNLPLNIVHVVHQQDIVEMDGKGGSRVVGQKLDAEKTFSRNPDVLIRLGTQDGKRVCRVLKDRTGTFATGEVVVEPHLGMWASAIKSGGKEASIETPEEIDGMNEAAIGNGTGAAPATPEQPHVESPAAIEARLLAMCKVGWSNWDEKRAWSKANKATKDSLPADAQERISAAFVAATPSKTPTTTKPAAGAAA